MTFNFFTMKVAIIGLGYVGLPLWIGFSKRGIKSIGIDNDEQKIISINDGKSYISHIDSEEIKSATNVAESYATKDISEISACDAVIICVPTPIDQFNQPDLKYINRVVENILPHLKQGQLVSLESTTYPGSTDEIIASAIKEKGFKIGEDIFLVYSPERESPGSGVQLSTIPKVIGGYSDKCLEVGKRVYSAFFDELVPVENLKVAELTKLLENIHRSVNLGMINEFKIICDSMNVDPFSVINAAKTKPYGFVPYYPGPGWGGHCIPVDPFYFSWKAKEYGHNSTFIDLSGEMNNRVIDWLQNKIYFVLNQVGKSIKNSQILLLGLSYKENIDDARESPSLGIFNWLVTQGANVNYADKYFPVFPQTRKFGVIDKQNTPISKEILNKNDLIVLLTAHDYFDYELIKNESGLIVDCKGVYSPDNKKIFRG
jgi:UDP-N-acetyl-D-glucosamine dehydrogenase